MAEVESSLSHVTVAVPFSWLLLWEGGVVRSFLLRAGS